MNRGTKMILAAGALATGITAFGMTSMADSGEGVCNWRKGHHGKMMDGHRGMGFLFGDRVDRNFSAEDIRTISEAFLLMRGNENLKVGEITATDRDSYMVQVVTKDNSLVKEVEVSKKTGRPIKMGRQAAKAQQ